MPQSLQIGGKSVVVDMIFAGAGELPRAGLVGGQVALVTAGMPAPPRIAYAEGRGYFYLDDGLTAVSDPVHVQHLPEPHLRRALAFINGQQETPRPARLDRMSKVRAAKLAKALARKAGQKQPPVAITDEASLGRATGGVYVSTAGDLPGGG